MRKKMCKLLTLVLAAVTVLAVFATPAYAGNDKSAKADKKAADTVAVAEETFSELQEQASQTALSAAGVDEGVLKYLVCYLSWTNHVPSAYEVKFASPWATWRYTIDLDGCTVLRSVCYYHH